MRYYDGSCCILYLADTLFSSQCSMLVLGQGRKGYKKKTNFFSGHNNLYTGRLHVYIQKVEAFPK